MTRTVYVDGDFVPEHEAKVSIFDRGFLFADGVYEVSTVMDGKLIDNPAHLARLERSLAELDMRQPLPLERIADVMAELVRLNGVDEGLVYLQVTRGSAERDFTYPEDATPTLVMFTQAKQVRDSAKARTGIRVMSVPDLRWKRRDIKTVQLLAQSMAKQAAAAEGLDDAWMVEDGFVTEGSSNNAFIVKDGKIVTRGLTNEILHGITRRAVLEIAEAQGLEVEERPFTIAEAQAADEAFSTSASSFVMPVVEIDGAQVGGGQPGPVARGLRERYIELALATAA